jgi:RNase adaptor protein for sRNA GlmZ degradation
MTIAQIDTIDATTYPPPPIPLCEKYSGISPLIQDAVLRDSKVRGVVRGAIHDLLSFIYPQTTSRSHANKTRKGPKEVCMSICCHAGTHRSVAIGERIAQGVKEEVGLRGDGRGVKVVVRHVSRVKGVGDPF